MKKLFAALLLICMVFSLCACGGNTPTEPQGTQPQQTQNQETEPLVTDPQPTQPDVTEPNGVTYTVKVVDEGGNPVAGVMVQLCAEICMPKFTDADGAAVYTNQEERSDYKASVTSYPAGYEALGEQTDFYFEQGSYEVTITVKAVA